MKLFTNKYPIFAMVNINIDGTIDKDAMPVEFKEGKVFKVLGVCFDDFILECEGKAVSIRSSLFAMAFTETELDL